MAGELGMETTRVHRLLRTLSHLGLVMQTDNRKYAPGPAISVLAAQTLHATRFSERALPHLEKLRHSLRKTVAMGVLWDRSVTYLYHGKGHQTWQKAISGHALWPATQSGLGIAILSQLTNAEVTERFAGHPTPGFATLKELLATLDETRRQGYAFVHTHLNRRTLALTLENSTALAVGVTGVLRESDVKNLLPRLQETATTIDEGLPLYRLR
jgi:DNA-binding IclR family transcriptional regulator